MDQRRKSGTKQTHRKPERKNCVFAIGFINAVRVGEEKAVYHLAFHE